MSIPCGRVPDFQSRRCHDCVGPKVRQAFSRSSEPYRPSRGMEEGDDLSIPCERMPDFQSRRRHDCAHQNSNRLSRDARSHPASRLPRTEALICRSLVKGCRISNHSDATTAGAQRSDKLSRDPRSHPAPPVARREALISGSLAKGWPISNHGSAMTAGTPKSDRLSRDPRSHPAPRWAGREALMCRSLLKGCRISNHADAMTAGTRQSHRLSRDPRSHPAPRVAGGSTDLSISCGRVADFQSQQCHDCGCPKIQQAFSRSSEPSRPSLGREVGADVSIPSERMRICNHGHAMTAGAKNRTGFLAVIGATPPLPWQGGRR